MRHGVALARAALIGPKGSLYQGGAERPGTPSRGVGTIRPSFAILGWPGPISPRAGGRLSGSYQFRL